MENTASRYSFPSFSLPLLFFLSFSPFFLSFSRFFPGHYQSPLEQFSPYFFLRFLKLLFPNSVCVIVCVYVFVCVCLFACIYVVSNSLSPSLSLSHSIFIDEQFPSPSWWNLRPRSCHSEILVIH